MTAFPQMPMVLESILVPIGYELVMVQVGFSIQSFRPELQETSGPTVKQLLPNGNLKSVNEGVRFMRYILDRPYHVQPGERIMIEAKTPMFWGEGGTL